LTEDFQQAAADAFEKAMNPEEEMGKPEANVMRNVGKMSVY